MDTNLPSRFLTAAILIAILVAVILWGPLWLFTGLLVAFTCAGLWEFFDLVNRKEIPVFRVFGLGMGLIIPIWIALQVELTSGWELALMVAVLLSLFILQFTRRESSKALEAISATFLGVVYVGWFLGYTMKTRLLNDPMLPDGRFLVLYLLLVTKGGDTGAYFVGSALGRHPLVPKISPKKSIEGAVGGLAASLAISLACRSWFPQVPLYHLVVLGILLGVLAQTGDLCESLIKRDCGVKDAGSRLPGFGGFLDVLDSVLFTAPVLYFYLRWLL